MSKIKLSLQQRQELWAYAFLFIPLTFFVFIRFYPSLFAFNVALRDWTMLSLDQPFVGLDNFGVLMNDQVFWRALRNTFVYVFVGVPVQMMVGLGIALMIHKVNRCVGFYRMIYFLPYVTSSVAVAWVWRWMYQPHLGILNTILLSMGFPQMGFLGDPKQALFSIMAMVVWQGLGFQMILFLAGLEMIPDMYYEAASIDGAHGRQIFWKITLPLLNPTIVFSAVVSSIRFLQIFTEVLNMSNEGAGGPLNSTISIVLYIYRIAFGRFRMGYASAATVVLFALIMVITLIQMKVLTKKVEY